MLELGCFIYRASFMLVEHKVLSVNVHHPHKNMSVSSYLLLGRALKALVVRTCVCSIMAEGIGLRWGGEPINGLEPLVVPCNVGGKGIGLASKCCK